MAYISRQCVDCEDCTKRCAGEFCGKDENGKRFCGQMYLCDNSNCAINRMRKRGEKQLHVLEAQEKRRQIQQRERNGIYRDCRI